MILGEGEYCDNGLNGRYKYYGNGCLGYDEYGWERIMGGFDRSCLGQV